MRQEIENVVVPIFSFVRMVVVGICVKWVGDNAPMWGLKYKKEIMLLSGNESTL